MESVDSTSSVIPLTVSFHSDRWRMSSKNRPSGSSGLASMSPLGLQTRNVEPSRMLIVLSLMGKISWYTHTQSQTYRSAPAPGGPDGLGNPCCIYSRRMINLIGRELTSEGWPLPDHPHGSDASLPFSVRADQMDPTGPSARQPDSNYGQRAYPRL